MSQISVEVCDHCGKRVDDHSAEAGWIRIGNTISRSRGETNVNGAWTKDLISGKPDFCSIECLVKALDATRVADHTLDDRHLEEALRKAHTLDDSEEALRKAGARS